MLRYLSVLMLYSLVNFLIFDKFAPFLAGYFFIFYSVYYGYLFSYYFFTSSDFIFPHDRLESLVVHFVCDVCGLVID